MIIQRKTLCLATAALLSSSLGHCLSQNDIPADTPVAALVADAKGHLAKGNANDALVYFDAAIARAPADYLTIFQRGATYLSLGRNTLATVDFDKVLALKPGFEGALLQRARIKSRNGEWDAAKRDWETAGKQGGDEYQELVEAQRAAARTAEAEKAGEWSACVEHANTALLVAGLDLGLRRSRARCHFEQGAVHEGAGDMQHVLQLSPGTVEPHLQVSAMLFYSVGDTEKGLTAVRSCLHSDPDSKPCKKLHRQEKNVDKRLKKAAQLEEKRQYNSAVKILVGEGGEAGLMKDLLAEIEELKAAGTIYKSAPNEFYITLVEKACHFYNEMNNKKKAGPYCEETYGANNQSLPALLFRARKQIDADDFEEALRTLRHAKEHHPSSPQVDPLTQKAQTLLKRSKTKDYYKVLGVDREADERTIKRAYRTLTKKFHPDKAAAQGASKEDAEKKMAGINEAWEVLSDPEKRARFDRGDDPNSQEQQGGPFQGSPFPPGGGQQFVFQQGGGSGFRFQGGGMPFGFPFQ